MNANRLIRYGLLGGIFLVPFVPLIITPSLFFPFVTGKNFAFRIITEILLALWFILIFKDASYRPKKSWLLWAVVAFVSIIALAGILEKISPKAFGAITREWRDWSHTFTFSRIFLLHLPFL